MTENNNTQQFIKQLANREGVEEEKIKEIIIDSIRKSYCQGENSRAELSFEFNSKLSVYRCYKIVEIVNDSQKETTKDSELIKNGQVKNEIFFLPLDIKNLSFSLNQDIKKHLHKDVEEINRERRYNIYKPQQSKLVKGKIMSFQSEYYLVRLLDNEGTGYWEKSEWKSRTEIRLGQQLFFLVKEVREKSDDNSPQIILTRSDNLFINKILEQEIPQLQKGIIAVRDILRIPGLISKVIVEKGKVAIDRNLHIDPTGTCIGERGAKIKSISELVRPERIDVAAWTQDKKKMLFNLISPVEPIKLIIKKEKEWEIIVPRNRASLLLQYEGEMMKKISNYLEVNIHVKILDEFEDNEILESKGKILQQVGNYKNIDVQVLEE
ncbi:MAG: Transcription termination/antitermination protein NusA [Mycoplasmataceae bacterium]|nr:MAG: Transcription termination/antitermination protein NusA [Mycoplasmataceae bacterium]